VHQNVEVRSVLALGAHPDDVEINCSGTLRRLQKLGVEIHVATMSLGDCGSRELSREEIAAKRKVESENACALLGAIFHYVGSSDFCIFNDDVHNRQVTALFRDVAPDIVFTHSPDDYLLDHETTSTLGRNACFYAPVPNYETSGYTSAGPMRQVPHLLYFDVMQGVDIFGKRVTPEFYVDISDEIDFKSEMLAQHASQREWLLVHHGIDDYLAAMQSWAAARGAEAASAAGQQVNYAEAFRQHRGHAYPHNHVLKELLSESVISNRYYLL
jgi:N-acetylglucosamine malate deacetylase 1